MKIIVERVSSSSQQKVAARFKDSDTESSLVLGPCAAKREKLQPPVSVLCVCVTVRASRGLRDAGCGLGWAVGQLSKHHVDLSKHPAHTNMNLLCQGDNARRQVIRPVLQTAGYSTPCTAVHARPAVGHHWIPGWSGQSRSQSTCPTCIATSPVLCLDSLYQQGNHGNQPLQYIILHTTLCIVATTRLRAKYNFLFSPIQSWLLFSQILSALFPFL